MRKLLAAVLACLTVLSLASCSFKKPDDQTPGDSQDPGKGQYPRVTYYDNKDGYKYAANLQNAHLVYNYGEDRGDGNGVVSYPFEFLNCEDYHYHCRYTLVGSLARWRSRSHWRTPSTYQVRCHCSISPGRWLRACSVVRS